jgi:hypothetical protein
LWIGVAVLLSASCGSQGVSDTGYQGTWQRGSEEGVRSVISIAKLDQGYRFAWNKFLADGTHYVRCGRRGPCVQYLNGKPVYEFRFSVSTREGSQSLFVECQGTPLIEEFAELQYLDQLELQPGGLELWSVTLERDGKTLERPEGPYKFAKTSDRTYF